MSWFKRFTSSYSHLGFRVAVCMIPFLGGCNTLKKAIPSLSTSDKAADRLPDDYTVAGVTATDYQIIEPVRCVDSAVTVKVLRPGETTWHVCNKYEARLLTTGTGGGGIEFGRVVVIVGNQLVVYYRPVAPTGTRFEIHSTLVDASSSLSY